MPATAKDRRLASLALGAVLACAALASWGRFDNGFVWDDHRHLKLAERLLREGGVSGLFTQGMLALVGVAQAGAGDVELYRPLTLLSFVSDAYRGGGAPGAFHATNLALHLAVTTVAYLLALALLARADGRGSEGTVSGADPVTHAAKQAIHGRADPAADLGPRARVALAAFVAAFFGLGPELADAHVWISGRFDLLAALFTALGLLACVRGAPAPSRGLPVLVFVLALGSLLAKESALLALPLLALVPGTPKPVRRSLLGAMAAAAVAYLALRLLAIGASGVGLDAPARLAALRAIPMLWLDGLLSLLAPHRVRVRSLREDYAALPPLAGLAALLACAALSLLLVRGRRRLPWLAWGAAFYGAALAPAAVITTRDWPGFGRLLYLPLVGLLPGAVELAARVLGRAPARARALLGCAAVAYLAVLAVELHAVTLAFRDDRTLFARAIELAPERAVGYAFLGVDHLDARRHREAVPLLERAHALAPHSDRYLQWLIEALLFAGRPERALAVAERGIASRGRAPELRLAAAYALLERDPERASRFVLDCVREAPDHAQCLEAVAFLRRGHPRAARFAAIFERLLREPAYRALAARLR